MGDRSKPSKESSENTRNLTYALSLAVYCSSWTFYGAVGTAATIGYDYLAIFLGPMLVYLLGYKLIKRIILICKSTNITSISDFISSRFGNSRRIAVLVTLIAFVGSIPYIALQLKAVSTSFNVITSRAVSTEISQSSVFLLNDTGFYITVVLAIFTVFFGTRHLNAAEHHRGLIRAVAFESIVKLIAILAIAYYAIFLLFDASSQLQGSLGETTMSRIFNTGTSTWQSFLTKTVLSMSAIILLPRQFHVTIVEANNHQQFKTAAWVMPLYLILMSVVVLPITLSGLLTQPNSPEDLYVLSLPVLNGNSTFAIIAFIGGASAATGMVIVAAIALSTMISNDLVVPSLLKSKRIATMGFQSLSRVILLVRRLAIIGLLLLAYIYYIFMDSNQGLANIGLISFAAIAQLLPAMIASMYWRKANKIGIIYGLSAGFIIWVYCLLLPTLIPANAISQWFELGNWLHPQSLFGFQLSNPLTHGTVWSLLINTLLLIFVSLKTEQSVVEKVQANFYSKPLHEADSFFKADTNDVDIESHLKEALEFSPLNKVPVTIAEIERVATKFIGRQNTGALIKRFSVRQNSIEVNGDTVADMRLLSQIHAAIGGVIGLPSAQKVMSEELSVGVQHYPDDAPLLQETSDALRFNRNLMQTTLENIAQGIAVVDENLNLVIWNDRYTELFNYPKEFIYSGMAARDILEFNASRGEFGDENPKKAVQKRLKHLLQRLPYEHISTRKSGRVIKHTGSPMPSGGYVTTYQDITDSVMASKALELANEELEERVIQRTAELEELAKQLKHATLSKTNFLAAASHDLLQPINAARLFSHSIKQRKGSEEEVERLVGRVEQSLNNANHLLRALLDISKLDAGGIQPEISRFDIAELINDICLEFEEKARINNITISTVDSSVIVESDRNLLFSVLQNFVSNAIRYCEEGDKILIGVRRNKTDQLAKIQVLDSGIGILPEHLSRLTEEFFRVQDSSLSVKKESSSQGLGLGLSIANRISELLDTSIDIKSEYGKGSQFSIAIPMTSQAVLRPKSTQATEHDIAKSLAGKTVLCLDNDAIVLDSLVMVLEDWGCEVLAAETYAQASEFFSEDVDAVLADFQLGGYKNGADFLKEHVGDSDTILAALITAVKDKSIEAKINESGWHFISKPVDTGELKTILNKLV